MDWDTLQSWASKSECSKTASPVDLSESNAGKCEALCEWYLHDSFPSQIRIQPSEPVLTMQSADSIITSTWNGQTATLQNCFILHPAQHTIDGTRYDGEFVMQYVTPSGKQVNVSVLLQIGNKETPSTKFFHAWIPFATQENTEVTVKDFSFSHALPPDGGYFVYSGNWLFPPCQPATWIVHKRPVTIYGNDIASLNTIAPAGYLPTNALGSRKVFFSPDSTQRVSEETLNANDDRVYIRCTALGDDPDIQKANAAASSIVPSSNVMEQKLESALTKLSFTDWMKLGGTGLLYAFSISSGMRAGTAISGLLNALVPSL